MLQSEPNIRTRAAALADELAAGLRNGRALEWVEEVLGDALLDVARGERERCATVADRRVALWEASARRMSSPTWPAEGLVESRERRKEALVIADAIREDAPIIPGA
jgi:hypothetical protein